MIKGIGSVDAAMSVGATQESAPAKARQNAAPGEDAYYIESSQLHGRLIAAMAEASSEISSDRVAELKAEVRAGSYKIDPMAIAREMLNTMNLDGSK